MASSNTTTCGDNMVPRSKIEAVQTVPPSKITVPRKVRQVSLPSSAANPISLDVLGGCVNMVLYYNKLPSGEDSGSLHAGWIKESLAKALSEQPLIAGRLQKGERVGGGGEEEEEELNAIVANDAGVRLVEAQISITMSEFLLDLDSAKSSSNSSTRKEAAEAELVFWKDVDQRDPQFSPLFYVQVTKFECGGYSFGISCSLLLADLLFEENFLNKWADIHKNMLSKNGVAEKPLFYLPNLKNITPTSNITNVISSTPSKDSGQTMIFSVTYSNEDELICTHAFLCVEEAETKLGSKIAPEFSALTYVKELSNMVRVEKCSKHEQFVIKPNLSLKDQIKSASWDDFGAKKLEFRKGNGPVRVSHWIGSVSSRFVMAIPWCFGDHRSSSEVKIIVCIPKLDES